MFCSLVQTIVCVLVIQGSLNALHLSGNGGNSNSNINLGTNNHLLLPPGNGNNQQSLSSPSSLSGPSSSSSASLNGHHSDNPHLYDFLTSENHHLSGAHKPSLPISFSGTGGGGTGGGGAVNMALGLGFGLNQPNNHQTNTDGFLTEIERAQELADMAQMDRERLMLLSASKNSQASTSHGRPIITGHIKMGPGYDTEIPHNFMFGNVVKQPKSNENYEDDYDDLAYQTHHRRPQKYAYGRIIQPDDFDDDLEHVNEFDLDSIDFDDYKVLEPDDEDNFDSYQYYKRGLSPEQRNYMLEDAPQTLKELFEAEQKDQEKAHDNIANNARLRNAFNIRLQQKLLRKRGHLAKQQQQQLQQQYQQHLQRNIFGQHHKHGLQQSKLSLANSEATATRNIGGKISSSSSPASSSSLSGSSLSSSGKYANIKDDDNSNKNKNTVTNTNDNKITQSSSIGSSILDLQKPSSGKILDNENFKEKQQQKLLQQQQKQHQQQQQKHHDKEKLLQSNHKRSGATSYPSPPISHSIASQLMLRTARGQRQYDVPQIECPNAMDGMERFACPTPDLQGRYRCIDDHVLCDGFIDCPEGEDEDRKSCMFYKTTKAHLDVLADALLRWARGR